MAEEQKEPRGRATGLHITDLTSRRAFWGVVVAAVITAAAVVVAALVRGYQSHPKPISFAGRVSDKVTGAPIRTAKVSIEEGGAAPVVFTDSEGFFTFPLEDPTKEIRLRVQSDGYESYDHNLVPARTVNNQDIHLTPRKDVEADLSGTVLDGDKPVQGASVTLDDVPGMAPVLTSTDGVFVIKDIPKKFGESVRVRVTKEGYLPAPYTEDVTLGASPPRILLRKKK